MLSCRVIRRRALAGALAVAVIGLAAGCGSSGDEGAPTACRVTSAVYIKALQAAPGEVRLEGDVPISECLTPGQPGGELAQIGEQQVIAATQLNQQALKDPTGPAALQLGYLIGAVSKGADSIHTDLVRRLNSAARFSPDQAQSADFERQFGRGYAAGHRDG